MADVRDRLDEVTLRDTKEDLVKRAMNERDGLRLGTVRATEDFINPILHKVEVDHDRDRDKDLVRKDPVTTRTVADGQWYGEPDHSPKLKDYSDLGIKGTLHQEELGTYALNKATGTIRPLNGAPMPSKKTAKEMILQGLLSMPAWNSAFTAANKLCGRHMGMEPGCSECARRERTFRRLIGKGMKTYGDPTRPADKTILVSVPK